MAFSVLVIIVALIPLFTMQGVPGKVFAPMSETYGFALTGAFLFAMFFAPVLASWMRPEKVHGRNTRLVTWLQQALCGLAAMGDEPQEDGAGDRGRRRWRRRLVAGGLFPGRRVHAQAGRRESVGARDAAAGCLLRDRREDGARYSRDISELIRR